MCVIEITSERKLREAVSSLVLDIKDRGKYTNMEIGSIIGCTNTTVTRMMNGNIPQPKLFLALVKAAGYELILRKKGELS